MDPETNTGNPLEEIKQIVADSGIPKENVIIASVPVVTTTPPINEMKPETREAVLEMAAKAAEMLHPETPAPAATEVKAAPVELKPGTPAPTPPTPATPAAAAPVKTGPPMEIKLVITLKKGAALVGISKTGADPLFFKVVANSMTAVVNQTPALLVEASKKWAQALRNPTSTFTPAKPAATTRTTTPSKPAAPKVGSMNKMV